MEKSSYDLFVLIRDYTLQTFVLQKHVAVTLFIREEDQRKLSMGKCSVNPTPIVLKIQEKVFESALDISGLR